MGTERGFDRIVNFGDAVVAIAITLLVLPLVELHTASPDVGAGKLIGDHAFEVVAFFLSFAVIGQLWLAHHRIFERAVAYDDRLLALQLAWLLTIAFLPFPTELLGTSDNGRGETAFYVATLLVSSTCLAAMRWHLGRRPALQAPHEQGAPADGPFWLTPALFAVALALSAIPGVGAWSLLVMVLVRPLGIAWRRRGPVGAPAPSSTP